LHLVRDRGALVRDRHADHVLLGGLDALLDRGGHLARLAHAVADVAAAVAHHDQGAEREVLASLDDLGHAVDRHDLVLELQAGDFDFLDRCSHSFP
jgi:hypothetical protein